MLNELSAPYRHDLPTSSLIQTGILTIKNVTGLKTNFIESTNSFLQLFPRLTQPMDPHMFFLANFILKEKYI